MVPADSFSQAIAKRTKSTVRFQNLARGFDGFILGPLTAHSPSSPPIWIFLQLCWYLTECLQFGSSATGYFCIHLPGWMPGRVIVFSTIDEKIPKARSMLRRRDHNPASCTNRTGTGGLMRYQQYENVLCAVVNKSCNHPVAVAFCVPVCSIALTGVFSAAVFKYLRYDKNEICFVSTPTALIND